MKAAQYDANWQAPAGWIGGYVIEAIPTESHWNWQPVCASKSTDYEVGMNFWRFFPGYTGPLKFRVVPVSATPP